MTPEWLDQQGQKAKPEQQVSRVPRVLRDLKARAVHAVKRVLSAPQDHRVPLVLKDLKVHAAHAASLESKVMEGGR